MFNTFGINFFMAWEIKLSAFDKKLLKAVTKLLLLAFLYGALLREQIKGLSLEYQVGINLFYIVLIVFVLFDFKQLKAGKFGLRK